MSEIKLKPCPFCGGEAHIFIKDGVRVYCEDCECSTMVLVDGKLASGKPYGSALNRVVEKWNRRTGGR